LTSSEQKFDGFTSFVDGIAKTVKANTGAGKSGVQISHMLPVARKLCPACPKTGKYYLMRTLVAMMHGIDKSNPDYRVRWKSCKLDPSLWDFHLKYGQIEEKAKKYKLYDADRAIKFVEGMRKAYPEYCLCDLACWICLSTGSKLKVTPGST